MTHRGMLLYTTTMNSFGLTRLLAGVLSTIVKRGKVTAGSFAVSGFVETEAPKRLAIAFLIICHMLFQLP